MDYRPPESSVHGILQARILEWGAIPLSRYSQHRDQTRVSCISGRFFAIWATGKLLTIAGPLYFQFHICGFNCQETETIGVGCNSRKFRKNKAWICCAPVAMHIALTLSLQLVTCLLHCTGIMSHLEMIYSMWEDMQILHHFIKGTWASADFDILNGLGTNPAAVHLANLCPKMLKCCLGGGELNCRDVG